ncbi:hypothetical protein [Ruficoccus sp. ZRK36]|uniref:hypothetical protein n=1 Tax=Ruficoccus sp. ZRK36 TaxID=2866311 RepID=UPI001C73D4B7|nr:hypothetical protein [Ruficoccus sp. ZRK36]QYY35306.1 hypothetical protein K0V07_13520 [Ruficoccus sp. ZRK36]
MELTEYDESWKQLEQADLDRPHLVAIRDELSDSISAGECWHKRAVQAEDTTWCQWAGQSDDGLKHRQSEDDDAPFPWEGASDTRIRLVDEKIREADRIEDRAFRAGRWRLDGIEGMDVRQAKVATVLLRWMVMKKMRPEGERQRRLARRWRNMYGLSFTLVEWEREQQLEMVQVSLDDLAGAFGLDKIMGTFKGTPVVMLPGKLDQIASALPKGDKMRLELENASDELKNLLDIVMDEERADEFLSGLKLLYPKTDTKILRKAMVDLRTTGATELPAPYWFRNQPRRRALKPFTDIFFPENTTDIQRARWFAVREQYTAADLDALVDAEGWDSDFVEAVKEKAEGKTSLDRYRRARRDSARWRNGGGSWESEEESNKGLHEVFVVYYRATDKAGIPGIFKTVICLHLEEGDKPEDGLYGWHGLSGHKHGKYPLVAHTFTVEEDELMSSVGIAGLIYTYQNEIKSSRDYAIDAIGISILPPVKRHARDMDAPLELGPHAAVGESVRGTTEFMTPPRSNFGAGRDLQRQVRTDVGRLLGSFDEDVPAPLVQLHQGELAGDYLSEEEEVLSQIFELMQQYMQPETVGRVTGYKMKNFPVTREEIQGKFDFGIVFDARELDSEFQKQKFEMLIKVKSLDHGNIIPNNKMIELLMNGLDPSWADYLIGSPQEATLDEIKQTQADVATIMSGQEPLKAEGGRNFQVAAGYMKKIQQASPVIQQRLQADPAVAMLWENHLKHLTFMDEQRRVNANTGRLGSPNLLNG